MSGKTSGQTSGTSGKPSRDTLRSVKLRRSGAGRLVATNARGAELPFGSGEDEFSPVELLLAAIAGCSALDVEAVTSRRAEPDTFEVTATGHKIRDETGNRLEGLELVFRIGFPDGAAGDQARSILSEVVARSHDRLCTVTRTVERPSPVTYRLAEG